MGTSILVVEDNPITRKLVRLTLEAEGYEVVLAGTARGAIEEITRRSFDLVLQDLVLPDMDGFELVAELRRVTGVRGPPILAFTGLRDEQRILAAGFSELILKPVEPSHLVQIVSAYDTHKLADAMPGKGKRILVIDNDAVQLRLQQDVLQQLAFEIETAQGGAEAIAMLRHRIPDLILTDLLMHSMDGFQLCRSIRSEPRLASVPIVVATNQELTRTQISWGKQLGVSAIVRRMPDLRAVCSAVLKAIAQAPRATLGLAFVPPAEQQSSATHLKQQAMFRVELERGKRMWTAMSEMLTHLADLTGSATQLETAIYELVARFANVLGLGHGAAFLMGTDQRLSLRAQLGFGLEGADEVSCAWGQLALFEDVMHANQPQGFRLSDAAGEGLELLVSAQLSTALIVPLATAAERLGVLVFGSANEELSPDWVDLARNVASPMAHAVMLAMASRKLAASEHRFRGIAESTADGIVLTDGTGTVIYMNPAAGKIFGFPAAELVERSIEELLPFLASGSTTGHALRADRREMPVELSVREFEDPPGCVQRTYVLRDLSQRARLEKLTHWANYDALTGLFNRRRFDEELTARLADARRHGTFGALIVIDLDRVKPINDEYGHLAGDVVLKAVASCLRSSTRECDISARLGGDEFGVLLIHTPLEGARTCATKIVQYIAQLVLSFGGHSLSTSASVGVAAFPQHGPTPKELYIAADQAMYCAKRAGGNRVSMFPEEHPTQ